MYTRTFFSDTTKGSERRDFISEMDMMKKVSEGHNPHVVSMLGCVATQEPLCLVTEFVEYGDLLTYLRSSRQMVSTLFWIYLARFFNVSYEFIQSICHLKIGQCISLVLIFVWFTLN